MILTQEILDAVGVCADGQKAAEDCNCIDVDLIQGIQNLENNGIYHYSKWARDLYSNQIALKLSKYYEYIQYLVFDPVNNHYKSTPNESDVPAIKEKIIVDNPDIDKTLIVIYEEIKSLDGIVYRFPL